MPVDPMAALGEFLDEMEAKEAEEEAMVTAVPEGLFHWMFFLL